MGGKISQSSDDSDTENDQRIRQKEYRKANISTVGLLKGISNKCEEWQSVISNMRQEKWYGKEAQEYILQEMLDTKEEIEVIVADLQSILVPQPRKHSDYYENSQRDKPKKPSKPRQKIKEKDIAKLQQKLQEVEEVKGMYIKHNRSLTQELVKEKRIATKVHSEKEDVLLRLSKVTGEKLKSENPNIADLNDPNRPTKLGEMFSELYDNEWTDAFEGLQRVGRDDRNSIRILLETCLDIFAYCSDRRTNMTNEPLAWNIKETCCNKPNRRVVKLKRSTSETSLLKDTSHNTEMNDDCSCRQTFLYDKWRDRNNQTLESSSDNEIDEWKEANVDILKEIDGKLKALKEEMSKRAHELLKESAETLEPSIAEDYLKSRWSSDCIKSLKPYIRRCLKVSWMMCVQNPPMIVVEPARSGSVFYPSLYKQYTAKGSCIDYVVWPAIRLHKDGPLISKGVAQGKNV